MTVFVLLKRLVIQKFSQLNGANLFFLAIGYTVISWLLLVMAKEEMLITSFNDFMYYIVVTGSTVGYGDMSPTTTMGKWCSILFIIPGGIGLFALVIGRIASSVVLFWQRGLSGKRKTVMKNHILILGWNGEQTKRLIRLLQEDKTGKNDIVLCVRVEVENPFPGEIDFVRVHSYTDAKSMERAGISRARSVIIDIPEDDLTLSAALFCSSTAKDAHILAYFQDEGIGSLLRQHCPNVECIPSVATEMLAKATIDPGSSQLHQQLLDASIGMTQYAITYDGDKPTNIQQLFTLLKQHYQATLIAIDKGGDLTINPDVNLAVYSGDTIYYIASHRIQSIVK